AEDLLTGLDLALAVRQAGHGRTAFFAHHPRVRQTARIVSPHTPVTPPRVVPVGMMVPLRRFGVHGELYLLAYARTSGGARFSMYARERGVLRLDPDPPPDIRWLDLIVGDGVTRRISLEPPPHPPRVTMTEASHSPG